MADSAGTNGTSNMEALKASKVRVTQFRRSFLCSANNVR